MKHDPDEPREPGGPGDGSGVSPGDGSGVGSGTSSGTASRTGRGVVPAELLALAVLPAVDLPVPAIVPLLGLAALSLWWRGKSFADVGFTMRADGTGLHAILGCVLGVAALIAALLFIGPGAGASDSAEQILESAAAIRGNAIILVLMLVLAWTNAVAVELVFRGYLLDRMMSDLGLPGWAAVVTGGLFHGWALAASRGMDLLPGLLAGAVIGAGYGVLYLASRRNLVLPIAVHGAFESAGLLLIYLRLI